MIRSLIQFAQENAFYVVLFGLIGAGFLVLRTPPTAVASLAELDALMAAGKPTMIEFFSNT